MKNSNPEVGAAIAWLLMFVMMVGGAIYHRTPTPSPFETASR